MMLIRIEETPNPNIRNFYPDEPVFEHGRSEFTDAKSLRKSPLAESIFDLGGIESLIIAGDMISVTKRSDAEWADLSPQIMAEILDFMAEHVSTDSVKPVDTDRSETLLRDIRMLIDARIRPALQKDGGNLEINGFEDGILYVTLTGKCACCPYAMQTLKGGVEKILKNYIPEVREVRSVEKETA